MATVVTCKLCNTAGSALTFHTSHDWNGQNPVYPRIIENDKTVEFTHVADGNGRSDAAVVYRKDGAFDWLVSWYVAAAAENRVYTEIGPPGCFDRDWNHFHRLVEQAPDHGHFSYEVHTATEIILNGTSPGLTASIETSGAAAGPVA